MGNPVNSIDPNGMDVYYLRSDGTMFLGLKTDEVNKVFSMDDNGRMNGKEITISDKDLLPQLAHGITAETSNSGDAFNFFKFASDNSNPEWSLKGYNQEKRSMGFLLTRGEGTGNNDDETNTVSEGDGSYSSKNLWFDLHSHPPGNNNRGPSGYISLFSDGKTKYYDSDNAVGGSDCQVLLTHANANSASKHYIYHEGSKQLIYYDLNTAAGNKTQNKKGIPLGIVKSATLLRTMILH